MVLRKGLKFSITGASADYQSVPCASYREFN